MGKNILICDDAAFMRMMIKDILSKNGYNVVGEAENGAVAVEKYSELKPDLVLMDIRMPEMNGLDATRIIKEINHNTPVIALSAYAFEENIQEAKAAGCDEFLAKPFRVEDLIDLVRRYLKD